jgi:hypothetical protein
MSLASSRCGGIVPGRRGSLLRMILIIMAWGRTGLWLNLNTCSSRALSRLWRWHFWFVCKVAGEKQMLVMLILIEWNGNAMLVEKDKSCVRNARMIVFVGKLAVR